MRKYDTAELIAAIDRLIAKADDDLRQQLEDEGYVKPAETVAAMNAIEDAVTDVLNKNCDDLLKRLQEATGLDDFITDIWPTIKSNEDMELVLASILKDQFDSLFHECVQQFLEDADAALLIDDYITLPAQNFIKSWSGQLAEIMHLTTNEQIEKILLDSQSKAMSIEDVAARIAESGIRSPGYRARRVAQTEVLRVQSYAQLEYIRQDPCVEELEWVHTGNHKNKPRPNHVAMNGTRIKKGEQFALVGADGAIYMCNCPRDTTLPASETVHCHCIVRVIRSAEKMAMSEEDRRALRKQYMDEVNAKYEAAEARFYADYGDDDSVSWEVYNSYFINL